MRRLSGSAARAAFVVALWSASWAAAQVTPSPAGPATATAASAPAAAFDGALRAYERNHWAEAYETLARLGDAGHPEAARMALDMWRHGPRLYGIAFAASSAQVGRWAQLWGCGGDATSLACQVALGGR